jgi:hypothetical protein
VEDDEQHIGDAAYQGSAQKHLLKEITMKVGIIWRERRTNKLNGQNLDTFVGPFQRLVEINGAGPRESQNKHSRKQAGNDNTFLETRRDIKVSEMRDRIPALAVSANRHILDDKSKSSFRVLTDAL